MTREEVYSQLSKYLVDLFEVPQEDISPDALLYEDLDLDSIDAVDLVVKLQDLTNKKIPPEEFKTVRTVGDVVDRVYALVAK
jgi:acyl carrier protein